MTTLGTSPRRFPTYACDRDPQPLFDELDAVLADLGVWLPAKQEDRLRRHFVRRRHNHRQQATVLAMQANDLLLERGRPERLLQTPGGDYELGVPPPRAPRPAVPTAPRAWQKTLRPADEGDRLYRFVLAVLLLCSPMLWATCAASSQPRPLQRPARPPQLEVLSTSADVQRMMSDLLGQLRRDQLRFEAERAVEGSRRGLRAVTRPAK